MKPYLKALMISLSLGMTACHTIPQNGGEQQASHFLEPEILQEDFSTPSPPRKVGVLLPLSGPHAALGQALRQATELSFFDHPTPDLELIYKDTEGTSEGALKAAHDCIQENVEAILGPVFATEVQALKPLLTAKALPILSFSNDTSMAEQGIFMLGFSPQAQVREILAYATCHNLHRIAALVPKTPYGKMISEELKKATHEKSMTLVGLVSYEGQGENIKLDLERLTNLSYQALFIPVGGDDLSLLLKNLDYYAFDYKAHHLLGTTLWETTDPNLDVLGGWYTAPTPENYHAFETYFEGIYKNPPKRIASLGYDAVVALTQAIKESPEKRLDFKSFIKTDGFYGANGFFCFKENGTTERTFFIFKWTEQGPQRVN